MLAEEVEDIMLQAQHKEVLGPQVVAMVAAVMWVL
jgi:hypothetical protein